MAITGNIQAVSIGGEVVSADLTGKVHSVSISGVIVYDEYWILRTGFWDDNGVWMDDDVWID
jgi:hypothetical protein